MVTLICLRGLWSNPYETAFNTKKKRPTLGIHACEHSQCVEHSTISVIPKYIWTTWTVARALQCLLFWAAVVEFWVKQYLGYKFFWILVLCLILYSGPLGGGGNNVSTLTHTYPRKPLRNPEWPYAITRLTAHFMCGLMSDLVFCKHKKEDDQTWHWMPLLNQLSLNNTNTVLALHVSTMECNSKGQALFWCQLVFGPFWAFLVLVLPFYIFRWNKGCIFLFLPKWLKLPRQCYSNWSGELGNLLGSNKEVQPISQYILFLVWNNLFIYTNHQYYERSGYSKVCFLEFVIRSLCCSLTHALSKDIQCHLWPYYYSFFKTRFRH